MKNKNLLDKLVHSRQIDNRINFGFNWYSLYPKKDSDKEPYEGLTHLIRESQETKTNRNTKFKDYLGKFSDYAPKNSMTLNMGENPHIRLFEEKIAEFTKEETLDRELYRARCGEILHNYMNEQIDLKDIKNRVSVGVKTLLSEALGFLSYKNLEEWRAKGIDISDSLTKDLSLPLGRKEEDGTKYCKGLSLAQDYLTWITTGKDNFETDGIKQYAAENALRAISAFMSISETKRFEYGNEISLRRIKGPVIGLIYSEFKKKV